jgi:MerR family transcriptional regulator, light-induced transcriptional regulator
VSAEDGGTGGLRRAYVDALVALEARRARDLVEDAAERGVPAERIYLEVLTPALVEIGECWERGEITVGHEHLATAVTSSLLAGLAPRLGARGGDGRRALVACTGGEQHSVGSQMVADFLSASGWLVDHLSTGTPADAVADLCRALAPDVVALSTTLAWNLPEARRTCDLLAGLPRRPRVVVGGGAYREERDPAGAVGADAYGPDPAALLEVVA